MDVEKLEQHLLKLSKQSTGSFAGLFNDKSYFCSASAQEAAQLSSCVCSTNSVITSYVRVELFAMSLALGF